MERRKYPKVNDQFLEILGQEIKFEEFESEYDVVLKT